MPETGVSRRTLERIGELAGRVPEGFRVHRTVERINAARREMAAGERPVDWGAAEMLAWGSLLLEGVPVRLAGQDSQRGTFAHRHAVWHDTDTGARHVPLANLSPRQGEFVALNTMLSELAVLGFEYGVSSADPRRLVMWEAQFGDFANGAQLVIDQYISSAEAKWHRMCGLVLLLPHGYEGMGPSTPAPAWSATCNCAPRTTCRSSIPPPRGRSSTSCAGRCTATSASPWWS